MQKNKALEIHARYLGTVPEMYDRHLGPVIFKPYAKELARRVAVEAKGKVLEIACGTGVLTQELRAALPPALGLVATDLNEPMLEYARTKLSESAIEWRLTNAEDLPFPRASFSAVVCQFGFMFIPDKSQALSEVHRVLADGGLLAFSIWGDFEHNAFARAAEDVMKKFLPTDFFKVPFGYDDGPLWRRLLADSGFTDIELEAVTLEACGPSARSLAEGLIRGYPVSIELEEHELPIEPVIDELAAELARIGGEAPYRSTMRALVGTARAKRA